MGILDRVKKLCSEKGISVVDLEKELKLSNGSIYKWIKTIPGADKVEKVADYFGVSVDYLLGKTAFKNSTELFEHWSRHNDPYFESPFDFGGLLKEAREKQGITHEEVSEALNITVSDVEEIEEGILPLNSDWADKYANFLGTSVSQIFFDNGMYDEVVPEQFHDNVKKYEELRKSAEEEALKESINNKITTIAAHHDGKDFTEEETKAIEDYIQFVLSKRNKK